MVERDRDTRERDILVAGNEYAYVQDLTKGDIVLYVGPTKISLSNTERLVVLQGGRFVPVRSEDGGATGVSPFVVAASSQYIVLENPPKDPASRPVKGSNSAVELLTGKKIVVPGPATFPLWPGQRASVVDGHELRENQFLWLRVYDRIEGDPSPIGTGKIVRGSEVSFYIPKTGLEVVPDRTGYIRNAVTLRRNTGLHVRAVKEFTAGADDDVPAGSYAAGQGIFIKDREGFFFPTGNLEVVGEVRTIPLSDKEGIYVRDIETGRITTEIGPKNYLPDPTRVEVVTRALDAETAKLYGITNHEKGKAVSVYIPPSYAVLVTAKSKREVVRGPQTRILAFDEDLEVLKLSTGKPKTDETLLSTCFLQTEGNKVSDIVRVKTRDHVELNVALSYRVSFMPREGHSGDERWFNVKNYVALLCDHLASIVRGAVRAHSIEQFHARSTEAIRNAILGEKHGDEPRLGRRFEENGLTVYDVEVLDVKILDAEVEKLLSDAQKAGIAADVTRRQEELRLGGEKLREQVTAQIYEAQIVTLARAVELENAKWRVSEAKAQASVELDKLDRLGRAQNEAEALE
ncbi:MAG: hypothetical protein ACAI25_04465, partial [Planctomycetota bacterium]